MPLSEAVGRRLGVEARMAQRGEKSDKGGSVSRKVQEGLGGAGSGSNNCKMCGLWGIRHMTMGRTHSEVP